MLPHGFVIPNQRGQPLLRRGADLRDEYLQYQIVVCKIRRKNVEITSQTHSRPLVR
jgi:hypothetical protein